MIALVTSTDFKEYADWIVLSTIGYLLKERRQAVVRYSDINLATLAPDEPLYFIEHGMPGNVGPLLAVPIPKDGNEGISKVIGQALKKPGAVCPKKIVLQICWSGVDPGGNNLKKADLKLGIGLASIVRGVAIALAKRHVAETTVTGYLGPAILSSEEKGKMYVVTKDGVGRASAIQDELVQKQNLPQAIQEALETRDIAARATAVYKATAVKDFFKDFIKKIQKENLVFADGKGVVVETAADAADNL